MQLGIWLQTKFDGALVGADQFGNRYYRSKSASDAKSARRWVVYKGEAEASKVPPEWHAWLHRITDEAPGPARQVTRPWQKEHLPNLSGTDLAYRPPGHQLKGGRRARATGDYEPWQPN